MANAGFVFVNKNARSTLLTRSDGEERRRILSHVQKAPSRPANDTWVVVTKNDYTFCKSDVQESVEGVNVGSETEKDTTATGNGTRACRKKKSPPRPSPITPSPSPYEVVSQVDIDSFASFSLAMTLEMQRMLAYYANTIIQAIVPTSHAALSDAAIEARRYIIACAGVNPAVLCAVLGAANASVFSQSCDEKYDQESHRYRHLTLVHVQKRLCQGAPVTSPTAFAVALLLLCECGQGDLETVKIHYNGLVKMLSIMGSPAEIPFALRIGIQTCLYYCCAMLATKPPDPPAPADANPVILSNSIPSPPTATMLANRDRSKLSRIASPAYLEFIGEDLSATIGQFYRLRLIRQRIMNEHIACSREEIQSLHIARLSLEHRLLSMPFDPSTRRLKPAQNVMRLVLYQVAGPPLDISVPRNPFRASLARQLKQSLSESNIAGLWKPCSDLLLMALMVTAYVAHQQEEWPWLVSRAAFVCRELGVDTFAHLERVLCDFDLLFPRFTQHAARMWSDINALWIDGDWNASIFLE